jgi:predicted RNase H-like nuclease (RuvC/YqgF family)
MDVQFLNSYNEVLFDNFVSVLKQNLLFQTNIKILEEKIKVIPEYEKRIKELENSSTSIGILEAEIRTRDEQIRSKDEQISKFHSSDAEKYRLQNSVNELSRENADLKEQLNKKQSRKKPTPNNDVVKILSEENKIESNGGTF